ncbi:uncharacterized protein N7511_004066 [Penicillium nucicola]|uniref:uncharacterized protein n=1 Tax=Penicillium nucicola TaxID=1850975 RepID=UPI0025456DA0|nr:uncharacterized protein N7511_004066 [Penicillium nucicola]KAJ5766450.1 hypothetical protein N7511_004066 [Penicillium nucicola]
MAPARRHIGTSRRKRRDDDGEDEGSMAGDLGEDSLSEGSADSHQEDEDADAEGSEESEGEVAPSVNGKQVNGRRDKSTRHKSTSPEKRGPKTTVSDTEAMMNGLKVSDAANDADVNFDQPEERTPSAPPTEPKRDHLAARKRRENDKYVKERDQNPAFVPTRGSFFLHDKRSAEAGTNGHRPFNKSKSRPYGLIVDGNSRRPSKSDASGGQWAHDLHDTVADDRPAAAPKRPTPSVGQPVPTAPRSTPPNRSFSSTTLVGNVPVVVSLPGMANPVQFVTEKRLHTRLPQHRPPLRRDKPVRISLPNQAPRYIFPSVERSFIFIPRALRPNQSYRGRGRGGGFYGGRRPSYYPTSSYTPSLVSRRSSLGQDGWPSPAGSTYSRPMIPTEPKPIVRMPPPSRPPMGLPPFGALPAGPMAMPLPHPAYRESRPAPIPMHQPRPQKTVSVADIESPATFPFPLNPPQPQQEQPFHHQVPVMHPDGGGPPSQPSATPLSQIPERAIHAAPFQPYTYQQPGFYPPSYPPGGGMYYPTSGPDYYTGPVGPGASVPSFPGQQAPYSAGEQSSQPGTVAHESNGTVYFYDANQMYPGSGYNGPAPPGPGSGPGGVVGMGGMMTPPGTTFYYPQQQSGYYGQ